MQVKQILQEIDSSQGPLLAYKLRLSDKILIASHSRIDFHEKGWIISEKSSKSWTSLGIKKINDEFFLTGPAFKGQLLNFDYKQQEILPLLYQLANAFEKALQDREDIKIRPEGIIIGHAHKEILILPPQIMDFAKRMQKGNDHVKDINNLLHPDFTGEKQASYLLSVLSYRLLCGRFPHQAESIDQLNRQIREKKTTPAHYINPDLNKEIGRFLQRNLEQATHAQNMAFLADMQEWKEKLLEWQEKGIYQEISAEKREKRRKMAEKELKSNERNFAAKNFFQKKGGLILLGIGLLGLAAWLLYAPIQEYLRPRSTAGLSSLEITESYYSCFNSLDYRLMEDCIEKDAPVAQQDLRQITIYRVINRVRRGTEGFEGFISAGEWIAQGKPPISGRLNIYGVSHLKLKPLNEEKIQADYLKWESDFTGEAYELSKYSIFRIKDLVYLKKIDEFWVIHKIEREIFEELDQKDLEPPKEQLEAENGNLKDD